MVVILHGGFWRDRWDRTTTTPLARDVAERGIAAWNVEYRRVGQTGGGWPGTFADASAALDAVSTVPELDINRVVTLGHSAGGQLALWLAARPRVEGRPHPTAAIALAGVCDLRKAWEAGLGDGAVEELLEGSPTHYPERFAAASPFARLPLGVPQLLVHGTADETVPPEQSRAYADAARTAGDEVELLELEGADHFDVIDPTHEAWAMVVERLTRLLGAKRASAPSQSRREDPQPPDA